MPPVNPKPLEPGELPENIKPGTYMLFGDSQCRGELGKAVERRLREYGIAPATGADGEKYIRENTSRVGAQIREFAFDKEIRRKKGKLHAPEAIFDSGAGISGPGTIEPFLKKGVDNVIWIGGGNSAGLNTPEEAIKDVVKNILRLSPRANVTLIGPPHHFKKHMPDTAKNQAYNTKRKTVADLLDSVHLSIAGGSIWSFNPYTMWRDQKLKDADPDGVHLNASGAKILTDRVLPPRKQEADPPSDEEASTAATGGYQQPTTPAETPETTS